MMTFSFDLACLGAFALSTILFLVWRVFFKPKPPQLQEQQTPADTHFDLSTFKVTDQPNMWMFDNLLSKEFLDYVDQQFEAQDLPVRHEKVVAYEKHSRSLMLPLDEHTVEFTNLLEKLGHFVPVEDCPVLVISDVWGDDQGCHLDHVEIDDLAPLYQNLRFLDGDKQRQHPENPGRIVPTLSIVVYFNDEGSINFPKLDLELQGKRGRIFMWQNYKDEERPEANPLAAHYGKYDQTRPKRVMACGILANETPDPTQPATTEGVLYCPNACGHHSHHDNPSYGDAQTYQTNNKLLFSTGSENRCLWEEAVVTKCTWNNKLSYENDQWSYEFRYSQNLVNQFKGVSGVKILTQSALTSQTTRTCGNDHDDICVYYVLAHLLGLDPHECCGWICACHLCNYTVARKASEVEKLAKHVAQHEKALQAWKEVGVLTHHLNDALQ